MMTAMFNKLYAQLFVSILFIALNGSLTSAPAANDGGIRLDAFVRDAKVPQNRYAELVLQLSWAGELERYDVKPFDNPILTNLAIHGSGSSNRVSAEAGETSAVREYTFQLQPQSIGMAYIEPMIILYTDAETALQYSLTTGRIPVQIVDPVRESRAGSVMLLVVAAAMLAGAAWGVDYYLKRKNQQKSKAESAPVVKMPEEHYLDELRTVIDPDHSLDGGQAFSKMSRLLRRFLHDKFSAPGLEATTTELYQFFYDQKFEDRFINDIRELLSTADIIKFSGKTVDRNEAMLACARIESILYSSLRGEIQRSV